MLELIFHITRLRSTPPYLYSRLFFPLVYACCCGGIPLGRKQVKKILHALLAATPLVAAQGRKTRRAAGAPETGSSASNSHHGEHHKRSKNTTTKPIIITLRSSTASRSSGSRCFERDCNKFSKCKTGSQAAPRFVVWLCRPRSRRKQREFRGRRAPHARCVQQVFRSKPGGVIQPLSVARRAHIPVYAGATRNASEMLAKEIALGLSCGKAAE